MKHTPGPWIYVPHCENGRYCVAYYVGTSSGDNYERISKNTAIVSNSSGCMDVEEAKANARLIASSPDLLEVCESFVDEWNEAEKREYIDLDNLNDIAAKILAAVKKARGEINEV